jgi:small-conductance mechanosensitive channel
MSLTEDGRHRYVSIACITLIQCSVSVYTVSNLNCSCTVIVMSAYAGLVFANIITSVYASVVAVLVLRTPFSAPVTKSAHAVHRAHAKRVTQYMKSRHAVAVVCVVFGYARTLRQLFLHSVHKYVYDRCILYLHYLCKCCCCNRAIPDRH